MGLIEGGLRREDGGARRGVWREATAEQGGRKQEVGGEIKNLQPSLLEMFVNLKIMQSHP